MKLFGDFEYDEQSMQLCRDGKSVSINGQCLELLVLMVDRPGELVTREEIRRTLWPDRNVDFEHSLDVLINRLRITLGDKSQGGRYIQTVPKKGYRFVEKVRLPPNTRVISAKTRSFTQFAAVAVLAALLALLVAHSRYQRFVPPIGVSTAGSNR
jgi:DNA-binding winged helix-turn-helix (wHTH) protein